MVTKQEAMIEVMINKALGGDLKAFEKVIQFSDKYGVFKNQIVPTSVALDSAFRKMAKAVGLSEQEISQGKMQNDAPG